MSTHQHPEWVTVLGDDAVCGRCPDSAQRDLYADNLLDHLNDPDLADRHGDWANPTPAQTQARAIAYNLDWPDEHGPRPAEVVVDALVPLLEEINQLRAQSTEADNTAHLTYAPVAPALAEAGFATYLPRDIETTNAVLLTEENLYQVAAAIGGKVLEGSTRRLSYPSISQGPTMSVAHVSEVLAQVPENQLDPWRVDIDQPRFYVRTATSLDRHGFLPGQPQHRETIPTPAPAEDADILREHAASLNRTNPARDEVGYKLDLALGIYDRLTEGSEVLRSEQVHAARYLRDRTRFEISPLPQNVKQAMRRLAEWMITQPSSTQAPITGKGDRYVDRHYNSYTDMGDGTLRSGGPQRMLDYTPRESYAEVIFRHGRLTRVPLDD